MTSIDFFISSFVAFLPILVVTPFSEIKRPDELSSTSFSRYAIISRSKTFSLIFGVTLTSIFWIFFLNVSGLTKRFSVIFAFGVTYFFIISHFNSS